MISAEQFKKIRAVISDIDGVLTDGTVGYGLEDFVKFFNYRDGHWLKMAKRHGYIVGLISGRSSAANRKRAGELGLDFCKEDIHNKQTAFEEILALREPVGRKLDFLMQEMNREINTTGSKCSNASIASRVVAVKCELEKIREQIQNIE